MAAYFPFSSCQRLLLSVALSIVVHALLFTLPAGWLPPQSKPDSDHTLAVRLVKTPAEAIKSKQSKPALLSRTASGYRMAQADSAHVADPALNNQPEKPSGTEPVGQVAEAVPQGPPSGFTFPRGIGLPWANNLQLKPVQLHEKPVDRYREMRAREVAAQRQRTMIAQIATSLSAELAKNAQQANGRCTIFQLENTQSLKLDCEQFALEELLRKNHSYFLSSLFQAHDNNSGFEIAIDQNNVRISPIQRSVK